MGSLFGGAPKAQRQPTPPSTDEARQNIDDREAQRRRQGRAAYVLTANNTGGSSGPGVAARTLTGL